MWRRLSDIFKDAEGGMEIFKSGIQPSDVRQGKLADCYFLSCLAALAEVPGRVESMFNTKEVNAAGIYSINFYINGKKQEVIVDDYIPCDKVNELPCFAYSADMGEIWAMLVEKAWAKLHGSYSMIRRGSTITALPHLTGAASSRYDHNTLTDIDRFWEIIKSSKERNYLVTGSTYETDFHHPDKKMGIISGHSYSVLSLHSFKHAGTRVKLLKLRNPYGNEEWTGDWSDESDKWTPSLRS